MTKYQEWLTTAPRTSDASVKTLTIRPILVLTGESDAQQKVFYDKVPIGDRLLVFSAVHVHSEDPMAPPEVLEPEPASNYRRWWNNPWNVVEHGGQTHAGYWNRASNDRLRRLIQHAHSQGLWIRFYTLDGATEKELSCNGWFHVYNFGSLAAAQQRWQAVLDAGADYLATDQYEQLATFFKARIRQLSQGIQR